MLNRWNEAKAAACAGDLELRAYSSRLIGEEPRLVLHGGGNTSVKSAYVDRFGASHDAIWVKASGYDLGSMGVEGFTGLRLDPLFRLARLSRLSDAEMVNEVNCARLDSAAANPSIEAIVHAVIPFRFVDHSHPDAVLTISNSAPDLFGEIYGDDVLVLPYVKPGFDLAVQFREAVAEGALERCSAIILQHHGVFTFAETAREAYERMIEVVTLAEEVLGARAGPLPSAGTTPQDALEVARARKAVAGVRGRAVLSLLAGQIPAEEAGPLAKAARRGTLTPEHVIHNKPFPAYFEADPDAAVETFSTAYRRYFEAAQDPGLTMLPAAPHWGIFASGHVRSFGPNLKRAGVSRDVARANVDAMRNAARMGTWQGLSEADLRDLEYWELEQAKLRAQKPDAELAGKIAVVSGAAAGIGKACAEVLRDRGAVVVGLDIDPIIRQHMSQEGFDAIVADLTAEADVRAALAEVVRSYGGIDILVSNAGIFRTGDPVETMENDVWEASLAVNLTSHRLLVKHAIPYLRHGIDPAVVFIGSRNVKAPGPRAAAYSVSKAGLTQLMRVLALELAPEGIKVNAVHPDAVFDTNLWTPEALKSSAERYGLTIEEYKTRNLLGLEICSKDIGSAVTALVDGTFRCTTGAQISVDGGNERVI